MLEISERSLGSPHLGNSNLEDPGVERDATDFFIDCSLDFLPPLIWRLDKEIVFLGNFRTVPVLSSYV